MRGTTAVIGVCALILAGCAAEPSHRQQPTPDLAGAQPSPTVTTSEILVDEDVVDSAPEPLHLGVLFEGNYDHGDVTTRMWSRPTFASGSKGFPRAVELDLTIGNNQGPPLTIRAVYKVGGRPARRVPRGGCQGIPTIPTTITSGVEEEGCLGYLIPSDAGRLILSGNSNFHFYVPIRAARD